MPAIARKLARMKTALGVVFCLLVLPAPAVQAQVVGLEIVSREVAANGASAGRAGPYEVIRGRIHGEVDPADARNTIIQDLQFAPRNARGRVEYVATFALAKPLDLKKASGMLVYSVVNRGNGDVAPDPDGHIVLVSGWQGDVAPTSANQTLTVPVAHRPDGSPLTGVVLARFVNIPAGTSSVPLRLGSMDGGPSYPPFDINQPDARLTSAASETTAGVKQGVVQLARTAWSFGDCRTTPFPGTPDPSRLCVQGGFDPSRLYELTYTAKDPLVLGLGLAATRDIVSFFRYSPADAAVSNPVAGAVRHAIAIGNSQSGNFIKTVVHLGFNEDLQGRIVWDGVNPRIAARQTPINLRFAVPGGAATLYEPGSEPVVWWGPYTDTTRGRSGASSLLARCSVSGTCPKVIEVFGSTEFWGLRMSPGLIGTDARSDIPLPSNVRRCYYPGTTHGGGRGGFSIDPARANPSCLLPDNPNPESDTTRALTQALIDWVVGTSPPPPSRYPMLARGELVPATRSATGFPQIPGLPFQDHFVNAVLDYDFGPGFVADDLSGVIGTLPPRITQVIPTYVPVVNADGNETTGVPSVLRQAPLGTYLGWNITRDGFFKGQVCGFSGGYWPFAKTREERLRSNDSRLSVQERYGTLEGYLCVVRGAVAVAVGERFLLRDDGARLIEQAAASGVLPGNANSDEASRNRAAAVCRAAGQ